MSNHYYNFKLPIFSGKEEDNLIFWLETAVNKVILYEITRVYWVQEKSNFLEGLALSWFNQWMMQDIEYSWESFSNKMFTRFGKTHLELSIDKMWDNLKQETTVEDYMFAHNKI